MRARNRAIRRVDGVARPRASSSAASRRVLLAARLREREARQLAVAVGGQALGDEGVEHRLGVGFAHADRLTDGRGAPRTL